jgi:ankyrin repeat protein
MASELNVNRRGDYGEVALHYTICLPRSTGHAAATQLLDHGADIFSATSAPIAFSEHDFILNKIDAGTTPLHLAIFHDYIDLFELFMSSCENPGDPRLWNQTEGVLALAVRYKSIACLRHLCNDLKWTTHSRRNINSFHFHQLPPMYYACRPDVFNGFYHSLPTETMSSASFDSHKTTESKDLDTIDLLSTMNSSLQLHKENAFNVLHLLASFGDSRLFERLLANNRDPSLIELRTELGGRSRRRAH